MENIDNLDKKILHLLCKNARIPNTKIAKELKVSKDTVKYRIGNLLRRGVVEQFYLDINNRALGFNLYILFFRFGRIDEKRLKEILAAVVKIPSLTYVSTCFGNWDLWVELLSDSIEGFNSVLNELVRIIGPNLHDYKTLISVGEYKRYMPIIGAPPERLEKAGKPFGRASVDSKDYDILKALETSSRMTLKDISQKTGLSIDVIRYRMKKLEKGVIGGYGTVLNPSKMGYDLNIFIINLQNMTIEKEVVFRNYIKNHPNIRFATKTTGKQEIILEVLTRNPEELQKVISDIRNKFSDMIMNYDQLIVFEEYKDLTVPPMPFK